jgi:serine/threonine protein kinase
LTGTGQFLGTPDYSAPEQIQGRAVDGRTDQYVLACVAYELLTGSVPFERDQGMAVLLAHLSEPPPSLGSRRPDLPAAADQVLAGRWRKRRMCVLRRRIRGRGHVGPPRGGRVNSARRLRIEAAVDL